MPPPPMRCAPIATALTGAHLPHPTAATLARSCGSRTDAAAPLTPTAPIREPPKQAAAPRACRERTRVLRDDMKFLRGRGTGSGDIPSASKRRGRTRSGEHMLVTPGIHRLGRVKQFLWTRYRLQCNG